MERLRDMLDAIAAIERYLGRGRAAFEQDELLQGWFVRNLQIIGEAARALPQEVWDLAPEITWPAISACGTSWCTGISISTPPSSGKPPAATSPPSSRGSRRC